MPSNGNGAVQAPVLDLDNCSKSAIDECVARLMRERDERKAAGNLPQNPFTNGDGWYDITPAMSHDALLLTSGNREIRSAAVKTYHADMAAGDWMPTAEAIGLTGSALDNGHHRLLTGYLGGHTFRSFVITSTPPIEHGFAYYDQGVKRSIADSLHVGGWNGFGKVMAAVISDLAMRYEAGVLGVGKQPRFKKPNPRQALLFMNTHADFQTAARYVMTNYPDAIAVVQSKPAAVFFGYLVLKHYDQAVLEGFFRPLASGANLADDSVILSLRNRLQLREAPGQTTPARTRLALLIKGFKMHLAGETMPRTRGGRIQPFDVPDVGQAFPRIEPATTTTGPTP
jgi:hypothetical protein